MVANEDVATDNMNLKKVMSSTVEDNESNHTSTCVASKEHDSPYVYDGNEVAWSHCEYCFDSTSTDSKTLDTDGHEVIAETRKEDLDTFTTVAIVPVPLEDE